MFISHKGDVCIGVVYMPIQYKTGEFWYMIEVNDDPYQVKEESIVRFATSEEIFHYIMEEENTP